MRELLKVKSEAVPREKSEIAAKMLKANYPIKDIALITDLSVDDVTEIAASMNS